MSKKALPTILILVIVLIGLVIILSKLKSDTANVMNEQKGVKSTNENSKVTEIPIITTIPTEGVKNPNTTLAGKVIPLTLISPIEKTVVNTQSLVVKGVTAPNAEVYINDLKVNANTDGNFIGTITLDEGENYIVIAVNDSDGNSAEKDFYITLNTL